MENYSRRPLDSYKELPTDEMKTRASDFYQMMKRRRTVRDFSDKEIPQELIFNCLKAAGTAPSGANMQPWQFVVVSNPDTKKKIRMAAEEVESDFYEKRAPDYWLEALAPLGTNAQKPYLEEAPTLIVIFAKRNTVEKDGTIKKHYYLSESVGIATGILITAFHNAGLACLTHTPSPMAFLRDLLGRPKNETPFLILVVGYPKKDATVPDIGKKDLDEIAVFFD